MTNLAEIAKALTAAQQEYKAVKRNKSGSINGAADTAIRKRLVAKLVNLGESNNNAWDMANDLSNRQK